MIPLIQVLIGCRTPAETSVRKNRPSDNPLRKTRHYATRPRDEEGYAPGSRKNRLYETLIGHTGSHTQESIKLIMQLISDALPYPATQQPAQPPGTWIPLAGLISRPGEAASSNSASDLVENTSPRYRSNLKLVEAVSPSSHYSLKLVEALSQSYCSNLELIEIQSLRHYTSLDIKEVLFPSLQTTTTRCLINSSHSQAQLVLTSSSKSDFSLQQSIQPPASRVRTSRSQLSQPPAFRVRTYLSSSLRSQVDLLITRKNLLEFQNDPSALTRLGSGSDLPLGALRGLGRPHQLPFAAHVNARPPSGGGLSNASDSSESGSIGYRDRCLTVPQIKPNFPHPIP